MSTDLPLVLVTEKSDPRPVEWMKQHARVLEIRYDDPELPRHLPEAQGLVVRTYTKVNAALLDLAPRLKVVGRGGVGLENIDVAACRARGIEVVYTPDANTIAVGDFVIGAILQLIRPWAAFRETAYSKEQFKRIRDVQRGRQMNELTLGILGMGRVGKRVGKLASAFGTRILYNDIVDPGPLEFSATAVDKPTLYRESDVLSLHVDMRPGNEHLVGAEQLAMMKPDAVLINTCRGEVLDIGPLYKALKHEKLHAAMLDVYDPEPPGPDFPLLELSNVLLTPHMAARTYTAIENMSWVTRDIVEVLNGRPAKYPAP
jgi:phosphoglycerate dehydrogenase-like enzyme